MVSSIIIPRHLRVSGRLADVRANEPPVRCAHLMDTDDATAADYVALGARFAYNTHNKALGKRWWRCADAIANEPPVRCAHLMNTDGHGFYFQSM